MQKPAPTTASHLRLTKKLRAKLLRALVAGGVGVGLGFLCRFLPEEYVEICRMLAKVASMLGGA